MRLFCCCGLIRFSYRFIWNRSCGTGPETAHGTCRRSGVVLLVSARKLALASHAILRSVSVSAGQSPHEAAALFTQLGSSFQREPNRFQHCLLRLIRRPGTYLHSRILPSIFS